MSDATINRIMTKDFNWSKTSLRKGRRGFSVSWFGPYRAMRFSTSTADNPTERTVSNLTRASSALTECQVT